MRGAALGTSLRWWNQLWIGDITEHWTGGGKGRTCARSRTCTPTGSWRVSIHSRMKSRLAVTALHNAVARRATCRPRGLHTYRRSQFL